MYSIIVCGVDLRQHRNSSMAHVLACATQVLLAKEVGESSKRCAPELRSWDEHDFFPVRRLPSVRHTEAEKRAVLPFKNSLRSDDEDS